MRSQSATASSEPGSVLDAEGASGSDLLEAAHRRLDRITDVDVLEAEFERVPLDASKVKHVADQPIEPPGLGDDAGQTVASRPGDVIPAEEHGRAGENARQRRAQLVADVLEEFASHAICFSQRGDLLLRLCQPDRRPRRRRLLAVQPLELGIRLRKCPGQPACFDHCAPPERCDPADSARGRKEDDQVEDIARLARLRLSTGGRKK